MSQAVPYSAGIVLLDNRLELCDNVVQSPIVRPKGETVVKTKGSIADATFADTTATASPAPTPTVGNNDMAAEVARLKAEIERLQSQRKIAGSITFGITDGRHYMIDGKEVVGSIGRVSLYGLHVKPITMSAASWQRLTEVLTGERKVRVMNGKNTTERTKKLGAQDGAEYTFAQLVARADSLNLLAKKDDNE